MKSCLFAVVALVAVISAATRVYDVEPYRNCNSRAGEFSETFVNVCDSIAWAEFFVGAANTGGQYVFQIRDAESNALIYSGTRNVVGKNYDYVRCDSLQPQAPLIKGKEYVLKITHSANESINFYYSDSGSTEPYARGHMKVGNEEKPEWDLCARIEGINRVISKDFFGTNASWPWWWNRRDSAHDRYYAWMDTAGVGWERFGFAWSLMQPTAHAPFYWNPYDSAIIRAAHHRIRLFGFLGGVPDWASTHIDSIKESSVGPDTFWSTNCPPRGLYESVGDTLNPWTVFIESLVARYGTNGHFWQNSGVPNPDSYTILNWELGNELNDFTHYWQTPDVRAKHNYEIPHNLSDTIRIQEDLFAQYCDVTIEAAHRADPNARVITGAVGGVLLSNPESDPSTRLVPGRDWLRAYYQRRHNSENAGLAIHPYLYYSPGFPKPIMVADTFFRDMDTIRAIANANGDGGKELWATEFAAANPADSLDVANSSACISVAPAYIFALAGSPTSFYDHVCWYCYWDGEQPVPKWSASLIRLMDPFQPGHPERTDTHFVRRSCYQAHRQLAGNIQGKRLNGRIRASDPVLDTCTFLYEFEDPVTLKRTWVGWRSWFPTRKGAAPLPVTMKTPVRTDWLELEPVLLQPGDQPPPKERLPAGTDGWFQAALETIPAYIHEDAGELRRPDLAVDSIWTEPAVPEFGKPVRFWARVRNVGTANWTMPQGHANAVALGFYANGALVGMADDVPSVAQGERTQISSRGTWTPRVKGEQLVRAVVNESKAIVELNWDNNAKYGLLQVR